MAVQITYKEIAESQLKTAIELFTTKRCFFSALTLAGAAEEIFGQILEEDCRALNKKKNRICENIKLICEQIEYVHDKNNSRIDLNSARNSIKHLTYPMPDFCPEQESSKMIKRAIKNYRENYGPRVPQYIKDFEKALHARRKTDTF